MHAMRTVVHQIVLSIVVLAVVASVLIVPIGSAGTGHAMAADGISTQMVTSVRAVDGGGQLLMMRVVVEPGITVAEQHFRGSATLVVISGTLQTTLVRGGSAVSRGGGQQVAEVGQTMNLSSGQVVSYSPNAVMRIANVRTERLVLMVTVLVDANEPVGMIWRSMLTGGIESK
jgi:quercetin dioxygenase-like cupin family protein